MLQKLINMFKRPSKPAIRAYHLKVKRFLLTYDTKGYQYKQGFFELAQALKSYEKHKRNIHITEVQIIDLDNGKTVCSFPNTMSFKEIMENEKEKNQ